jgi:predicted transcriptional regulator
MNLANRCVREVMSYKIVTLSADDHLDLAEDIMRLGQLRHMPVLEGNRLVGVVSGRDLLAASLSKTLDFDPQERRTHICSVEVREVMSSDLFTVSPDAPLEMAASLMVKHKIGCLPVAESDGVLVGLLTETDLLKVAFLTKTGDSIESNPEESEAMTDVRERIHEELDSLRRTRDELRVQIHLARAEGKDLWDQLEHKFEEVEAKVKSVARQAEGPVHDVGDAAKLLLAEIRDGYRRIRETL